MRVAFFRFVFLYLTMRYLPLILILLCLNIACSMHMENRHWVKRLIKCKSTWVYFKLDHQVRGKILSYSKGICGYIQVSSNTIIHTSTGDTIRVLEMPCYGKIFAKSDSVLVTPLSKPDSIGGVGDLKFDCKVKKTCHAEVTKIQ